MYVNDNNDRFPLGFDNDRHIIDEKGHWSSALGAYMDYDFTSTFLHLSDTVGTCPSHEPDHVHGPDYISYAINTLATGTQFTNSQDGPGGNSTYGVEPSTIIFADCIDNWHLQHTPNSANANHFQNINYRHNDKSNTINWGGAIYVANRPGAGEAPDPPPYRIRPDGRE